MVGFLLLFIFITTIYYLLFATVFEPTIDRMAATLLTSYLTLVYSPQITSTLFNSLSLSVMLMTCSIPITLFAATQRKLLSLTCAKHHLTQLGRSGLELCLFATKQPYLLSLLILLFISTSFIIWVSYNYTLFGWDGWGYHTAAIAWFHQNDGITQMPLMPWITGYPKNIEMLSLWVFKFDGHDQWIETPNLLIHYTTILFAYGIARHVGLNKLWSLATALIYFLSPTALSQTWTTYIDQAFADSIVMMLFFLSKWWDAQNNNPKRLYWAYLLGLSLGHLAQTKGSGLHVIIIIGLLLSFYLFLTPYKKHYFQEISLIATCAALCGAGWYLGNWIIHGNPFYPFSILLPGTNTIIFEGLFEFGQSMSDNFRTKMNIDDPWWMLFLKSFAYKGWGLHFFILSLPLMFYAAIVGNKKLKLLLAFAGLYLLITPFSFNARYSIIIIFIGTLAFAYMIPLLFKTKRQTTLVSCISVAFICISIFPLARYSNPIIMDKNAPPPYEEFSVTNGFKRFALTTARPTSKIGLVNLELKADNPHWYFYFGPQWKNTVEPYNPKNLELYDFIVCGNSSNLCKKFDQLDTFTKQLTEKNVAIYENIKTN